ncbi:unnamed protein product [Pleuronectes platessa]|uniref:Uncharacterized protein n=1 Tax=Pleuronectes platessa TaxID=8262 RepID=A0A9N7U3M9_PLEPL|nr:unnamed protein product [Pleuronectes platessa]
MTYESPTSILHPPSCILLLSPPLHLHMLFSPTISSLFDTFLSALLSDSPGFAQEKPPCPQLVQMVVGLLSWDPVLILIRREEKRREEKCYEIEVIVTKAQTKNRRHLITRVLDQRERGRSRRNKKETDEGMSACVFSGEGVKAKKQVPIVQRGVMREGPDGNGAGLSNACVLFDPILHFKEGHLIPALGEVGSCVHRQVKMERQAGVVAIWPFEHPFNRSVFSTKNEGIDGNSRINMVTGVGYMGINLHLEGDTPCKGHILSRGRARGRNWKRAKTLPCMNKHLEDKESIRFYFYYLSTKHADHLARVWLVCPVTF